MEANFFRFLAAELGTLLTGRRIDKTFLPGPSVWTLTIQNTGAPLFLIFRPAKSAGHLFLTATKPVNPQQVPAMAMWFRKRLANRKILGWRMDWPSLRLALELSPRDTPPCGRFLILDCRNAMTLAEELDDAFLRQPEWPALEDVADDPDIWREYPQISPRLRREMTRLSPDKALEVYLSVAGGTAATFHIETTAEGAQPPVPWPVPDGESFASALDAANAYGERTLFPLLETAEERPEQTQLKRARKKVQRNLTRLDQEKARLAQLAGEQVRGEALQAVLYRFRDVAGLESLEAEHPGLGPVTVPLNPHLSVAENMEHYFRMAAKAKRGFPHLERRRRVLLEELEAIEAGRASDKALAETAGMVPAAPLPSRYRGMAVSLFRTSDGFTVIRGKNKQANHAMLSKAASPFDYWFHLAEGASSHVILRRDHPGREVPESSLIEAATLCALKSYRSADDRADVMYALVKDVRKVKGFAQGQVVVDQRIGTLRVALDGTLEEKLAQKKGADGRTPE
ncbi:MAG: NFACT RNA binding domain-containing protein [Pseudodesulfovibrio sp.]